MRETLRFVGQAVTQFRTTGAVIPSSQRLARAMVAAIGPLQPGQVIVELGPGTGVFTCEMVRSLPSHPVVAVEFNQQFARALRSKLPHVCVVEGCASDLRGHIERLGYRVDQIGAVVSGLPLLSMPHELGDRIWSSIAEVLCPGRRYIQFSYAKSPWRTRHPPGFDAAGSHRVWMNFPPAVVLPFERCAG